MDNYIYKKLGAISILHRLWFAVSIYSSSLYFSRKYFNNEFVMLYLESCF